MAHVRMVIISVLLALTGSARAEELVNRLEAIQGQLKISPGDLDLRLQLAKEFAHRGQFEKARKEALEILKKAPHHWDAHLLVARVDAWDARYADALERIKLVRKGAPYHVDAVILWADVSMWAGKGLDTRDALKQLEKMRGKTADLYYRHAALRHSEMNVYAARRFNKRALGMDELHKEANGLDEEMKMVSAEAAMDFERFPVDEPGKTAAAGIVLSLTALPRALVSVTGTYEYRYRFATSNHRVGLRADGRLTKNLTVWVAGRAGLVKVVPELVAQVGADYTWASRYQLSLQYRADKMTWPGHLHRLKPLFAVALPRKWTATAQAEVGVLRNCGDTNLIQGVGVGAAWNPGRWRFGGGYFFGTEAERPVSPGLVAGNSPCPTPNSPLPEEAFRLIHTNSHTVASRVEFALRKNTILRGGYSVQSRFTGDLVHGLQLGIRQWF